MFVNNGRNLHQATLKDTTNPAYIKARQALNGGIYNGAYYYSREIVENIMPLVRTCRPWDTLGMRAVGSMNNAIVFLHHNLNWDRVYSWLDRYQNQIFVCSSKATYEWAISKGKKAIFLPLSIDVEYVQKFSTEKAKETCYAGNKWKFKEEDLAKYLPKNIDFPPKDLPREELLKFIAPYKTCYAIGRCALEARALGCKIRKCDSRYSPSDFKLLDNREAAAILQKKLDEIDNCGVI